MELARLGLIPSIVESTSSADTQSSMHFDSRSRSSEGFTNGVRILHQRRSPYDPHLGEFPGRGSTVVTMMQFFSPLGRS